MDFIIGKKYSFDVWPTAILGTGFKNVSILALLDYETAISFSDIEATHVNVFPHLPAGTPNRPGDFQYLLIRVDNGDKVIIGIPWINGESVIEVASLKINVVIEDVDANDLEGVRACLSQNGYDKISLKLIGV